MRREKLHSCKARLRRNSWPEPQYNRHDMATEVNLDAIIEALELADDSLSSYLDVETGEVRSITEEEFDLAEDLQTVSEDLPDWQREAVKLARDVQKHEGKRYLALPEKFDVHEWAIMDRFSETLKDAQMRNDFHGGIRGVGAFRLFKHLLTEYNCGTRGIGSSKSNSGRLRSIGAKRTALRSVRSNLDGRTATHIGRDSLDLRLWQRRADVR